MPGRLTFRPWGQSIWVLQKLLFAMVLYVAVVAILNLGLGYWLAVYLGSSRMPNRVSNHADVESDYDDHSTDEYSTYESGYESELETAASI